MPSIISCTACYRWRLSVIRDCRTLPFCQDGIYALKILKKNIKKKSTKKQRYLCQKHESYRLASGRPKQQRAAVHEQSGAFCQTDFALSFLSERIKRAVLQMRLYVVVQRDQTLSGGQSFQQGGVWRYIAHVRLYDNMTQFHKKKNYPTTFMNSIYTSRIRLSIFKFIFPISTNVWNIRCPTLSQAPICDRHNIELIEGQEPFSHRSRIAGSKDLLFK